MKKQLCAVFILLFSQFAFAADGEYVPVYKIVTDIPDTSWLGLKTIFNKDALPDWALVLGSTAVLYHYDPEILSSVQANGRDTGLGNNVNYTAWMSSNGTTLFAGPKDSAGWLYFLGDGVIPIMSSVGMMGGGYLGGNSHIYNTGEEMANGLLTAAIFDQLLKHIAGRESPSARTSDRGTFRPLPNLKAYQNNTSKYDAMASGHIMTATVMFTVFQQEYPEYNAFTYPLEAVWLTALGLGMINVGVHWASDYPIGIAMGYVFGKSAVALHHPAKTADSWRFFPGVDPTTGTNTMNAMYSF